MQTVTVLGATGSIGCNTLDVINRHPDKYRVFAITGNSQLELLMEQAQKCAPRYVVIADDANYKVACELASQYGVDAEILSGAKALEEVSSAPEVDAVMAAIVGAAGLLPTLAAVKAGKRVLLANKEALVMSGALFIEAANQSGAEILPIDSEHNAIFQCLPHDYEYGNFAASGIRKILLTGSGGPFRERPLDSFSSITIDEASTHPNWSMGRKITIDSATMMNKGLEVIEAHWLFGLTADQIDIVIHPQSIIHSMVEFIDGSVKAQLGYPDMKIPIQYALAYPERLDAEWEQFVPAELSDLTFEEPDTEKFPCIRLAYEALARGGTATAALNVANDNTVSLFLNGTISFPRIAEINEAAVAAHRWIEDPDLSDLVELEQWGKSFVESTIEEAVTA